MAFGTCERCGEELTWGEEHMPITFVGGVRTNLCSPCVTESHKLISATEEYAALLRCDAKRDAMMLRSKHELVPESELLAVKQEDAEILRRLHDVIVGIVRPAEIASKE